jgi:RNA polymerase sigma-70 factor (ECF subfamily)
LSLAVGEAPVSTISNPLDQLYTAHHAMVFRTAHRVTGNAADAEDVLQTVFLRILKRDTSDIENPESYLRRAAVNAALDIVRSRKADNSLELERTASSGSCTELRDLRDTVRRTIATFPPKTAEMIALRFFEGYTNPEIAKMMGISQIMVAVTVHRARKKLQLELKRGAAR